MLQGSQDPRGLQVESDEIVAAARKKGLPVEYVLFPDEGHGFVKKENQIKASARVHEELIALLNRGGVIAGGSAGATIQGSYLIRGDTKDNTIIMGDHEEGFGFVRNVAIDQHLLVRNRAFDMFELLEKRPELLGIGLDEGAAILVQGAIFESLTKEHVAIYDGKRVSSERDTIYQLPKGSKEFYFLSQGDFYDMEKRMLVGGRAIAVPRNALQEFVGKYHQISPKRDLYISLDQEGLVLLDSTNRKTALYAMSENSFFENKSPLTYHFAKKEGKELQILFKKEVVATFVRVAQE